MVLLEVGKAVSLIISILSLCALLESAFLIPGSRWEERLAGSLLRILVAGCVCFASGLIFQIRGRVPEQPADDPEEYTEYKEDPDAPVTQTLPVRLFFWALAGMALLFFLSWYLEEYYVPLLWRNQPH
jgi:hypothetical protein